MKKKSLATELLAFGLLIPLAVTVALTFAFCILQKNYYYLPRWLDGLIGFFYDAKFIFIYIALFFLVGMTTYIIAFSNAKAAAPASVLGVVFVAILPIASLVITFEMLKSDLDADALETYLRSDLLCLLENVIRYLLFAAAAWVTRAIIRARKSEPKFERPYIVPKGAVSAPLFSVSAIWLLSSVLGVILLFRTESPLGTLIYESLICIFGYFISVLSAYFSLKRKVGTVLFFGKEK